MKALLIGESRQGKFLQSTYELIEFAKRTGAEAAMFLVSPEAPRFAGKVYLADPAAAGELNPAVHAAMAVAAAEKEGADMVVLCHSPYGWDLAPHIAHLLGAGQISEVVDYRDGVFYTPALNGKLRLSKKPATPKVVVTLQSGAFNPAGAPEGSPSVEKVTPPAGEGGYEFLGFEAPKESGVDLAKAKVIVTAGRGVGKVENVEIVRKLAAALGGELGATRPVVDAGWVEAGRQVGASGQTVSPKLYIACGVSGAAQHLAGMKRSGFIASINTDPEAPIAEVSHVVARADLKALIPELLKRLGK